MLQRYSHRSFRIVVALLFGRRTPSSYSHFYLLAVRISSDTNWCSEADCVLCSVFSLPSVRCIRKKNHPNTCCSYSLNCPNHRLHSECLMPMNPVYVLRLNVANRWSTVGSPERRVYRALSTAAASPGCPLNGLLGNVAPKSCKNNLLLIYLPTQE